MKKTAEKQIKDLLISHPTPPLEVVIPILEKAGRGEQELTAQIYETYTYLTPKIREILGLKSSDMKTLAKLWEVLTSLEGIKIQPIELTESRYCFSISDCPMVHVGKGVGLSVKSKFCDLICNGGSKALMDEVLGSGMGVCSWNKALIKGAAKCTLAFELVKNK